MVSSSSPNQLLTIAVWYPAGYRISKKAEYLVQSYLLCISSLFHSHLSVIVKCLSLILLNIERINKYRISIMCSVVCYLAGRRGSHFYSCHLGFHYSLIYYIIISVSDPGPFSHRSRSKFSKIRILY